MEKYFPGLVSKYKQLGLSHLTPSEVLLTALVPSFSEYFYEKTGQSWPEILDSYHPILENHLEHPDKTYRFSSGKAFLHCLDLYSTSNQVIPKYTLTDDSVLQKLSESLKAKNQSLIKILVQSDVDCDGFMTKSELVTALEKLEMSPYDIISCIRIAGYRPGINFVPIAGFCDLIGRVGSERKIKEFNLLTKVLNTFATQPGGVDQVFRALDKNRDGRLSFQEFRAGVKALQLDIDLKDSKNLFVLLDRDNSKTISLIEFKAKLQELGARPRRIVPVARSTSFDPPGEFHIKFLKGTLPNDAVLGIELQRSQVKTSQTPIWGETLRLKANKRSNCQLLLDYKGSIGTIDLAISISKEARLYTKLGHFEVTIISKYVQITGEDLKEQKAAIVIQRAWRRYSSNIFSSKTPKKLLTRKTISAHNKRFLLAVYSVANGLYCQLHPAFTDQIPQDTILSYGLFPEQELESLLSKVVINPNLTITTSPDKSRIRGNLWVELIKITNVAGLVISFAGQNFEFNSVGDKAEIKDVKISKPLDLNYKANTSQGSVFWVHALACPYKWTVPAIVSLPAKANFSLRFRWLIGSHLGELEKAAILIQKQWKEKQRQRKVVRRKK